MGDMTLALKVYSKIRKSLLKRTKKYEIAIYPYLNGREQGLIIIKDPQETDRFGKVIMFSENRNSDDIVIYSENVNIWDFYKEMCKRPSSFLLSEETYQQRKFFAYDKVEEAAGYIESLLKGDIK